MVELNNQFDEINFDIKNQLSKDCSQSPKYNEYVFFDQKIEDNEELTRILKSYNISFVSYENYEKRNDHKETHQRVKSAINYNSEVKKNYDPISNSKFSYENESTVSSFCQTEREKEEKGKVFKPFYHVPCINCNNLIHINDIENHSHLCTIVHEEVLIKETSENPIISLDNKLNKLLQHIIKLQDLKSSSSYSEDILRDMHYIISLSTYIEEALNNTSISLSTILSLKKIINNLNTFILKFNGILTTLIYIERAKLLINEKRKLIKKDLEKNTFNKESEEVNERNQEKIAHLFKLKQEKLKEKKKLELEKEYMVRKVCNLKISIDNTPERNRRIYNKTPTRLNNSLFYTVNTIEDISSEVDKILKEEEFSDEGNSISSSPSSGISENELKIMTFIENNEDYYNYYEKKSTDYYKEFVKLFLRIKFGCKPYFIKGQNIDKNMIWKQIVERKIQSKDWKKLILQEMNNSVEYESTVTSKISKMPTINEEININESI